MLQLQAATWSLLLQLHDSRGTTVPLEESLGPNLQDNTSELEADLYKLKT